MGVEDDDNNNHYAGYVFSDDAPVLDRVDLSETSPRAFFRDYISKRKPCIITTTTSKTSSKTSMSLLPENSKPLTLQALQQVAGNVPVQVERRLQTGESFGQNRTRERQELMTIQQLIQLWEDDDSVNRELLYLSTQQQLDDADDDPFFGPCRNLLDSGYLQPLLALAGNLLLDRCNLWMGMAQESSSSGLHHDFHDNFYILVAGVKCFRLYAPSDFCVMETFGTLNRIHENGLISYQDEPTRSDGVPLRLLLAEAKVVDGASDEGSMSSAYDDDDDDDDGGVVLGKGFDYQSSDEDVDFNADNVADDYDDQDEGQSRSAATENEQLKADENALTVKRPPSFSAIDPTQPKNKLKRDHPEFGVVKECIVELQAGEALYLPASWFHCVTSSPGKDELHLAINYWYNPPDQLDNFETPYASDFWKRHYDVITKAK
jgi:hypothetical protein